MAKFMIEIPHEAETTACVQAVESFLNYGSHFAVNADWGCMDGVHKAWITIEAKTKDEARAILPVAYRSQATIVQLNKFTMKKLDEILRQHEKKGLSTELDQKKAKAFADQQCNTLNNSPLLIASGRQRTLFLT